MCTLAAAATLPVYNGFLALPGCTASVGHLAVRGMHAHPDTDTAALLLLLLPRWPPSTELRTCHGAGQLASLMARQPGPPRRCCRVRPPAVHATGRRPACCRICRCRRLPLQAAQTMSPDRSFAPAVGREAPCVEVQRRALRWRCLMMAGCRCTNLQTASKGAPFRSLTDASKMHPRR